MVVFGIGDKKGREGCASDYLSIGTPKTNQLAILPNGLKGEKKGPMDAWMGRSGELEKMCKLESLSSTAKMETTKSFRAIKTVSDPPDVHTSQPASQPANQPLVQHHPNA